MSKSKSKSNNNSAAPATKPAKVTKDHGQPDVRRAAIANAGKADAAAAGALVAAIVAMARAGACTVEEVRDAWPTCNSPAVYASGFNVGDKAATALGEAKAVSLIQRAEAIRVPGGMAAFAVVQHACRFVAKRRKAYGSKPAAGLADKWAREALADARQASQAKADAASARKAEAKAVRAAAKAEDGGVDAEAAGAAPAPAPRDSHGGVAAMALNLSSTMARMTKPDRAAGDWAKAVKLAGQLAEALAAFRD